jgi:hypothetical protein
MASFPPLTLRITPPNPCRTTGFTPYSLRADSSWIRPMQPAVLRIGDIKPESHDPLGQRIPGHRGQGSLGTDQPAVS